MAILGSLKKAALFVFISGAVLSCKSKVEEKEQDTKSAEVEEKGLKDYYQNFFPMGVAVAPTTVEGEAADMLLKHFNSITPENVMKMGPIHPEQGRFFWEEADKIANFAKENDLRM